MIVIDERKLSKDLLKDIAFLHGYADIDFFIEKHHLGIDTIVESINNLNELIKRPFENMN